MTSRSRHEIETLGADLNHVHLLCPVVFGPAEGLPQRDRADIQEHHHSQEHHHRADVSRSARTQEELKKELWGGKFWTGGFYVSTVGQRGGYAALTRYIEADPLHREPGQEARGQEARG